MKLLQIYNQYRSLFGGEESVVYNTAALVEAYGGRTKLLLRSSRGIENRLPKRIGAFFSGFYNFNASRELTRTLASYCPDVIHAHNLYPLYSPAVLVACRRARVPVVLSLHNHSQTCPNSDHLYRGRICERCLQGGEIHCVLRNCRNNLLESIAYAGRSFFARRLRLFKDNVDIFVCMTQFAKQRLIKAGFDANRIAVLHNMVNLERRVVDPGQGGYVAFAGRLDREKGIHILLAAGRLLQNSVPLHLAGDGPFRQQLESAAPPNTRFLGQLGAEAMDAFYSQARILVLPSECFEMCPLVISEAMSHGLPVIASRIGGIPELVDDGETGLLFEPGNTRELAHKIDILWSNPELCRRMGAAGRRKAVRQFGADTYYRTLSAIYDRAIGRRTFSPDSPPESIQSA
jgi:glycosyltransferase involved in cell wall biosynthesis